MSIVIHAAVVAYGLGLAFLATIALTFLIERWSRRSVREELWTQHPERRRTDRSWFRRAARRRRGGPQSIPIITMAQSLEPALRAAPLRVRARADDAQALELAGD
jgi:hypothetical protein